MIANSLETMLTLANQISRRLARETKGQDLIEYAMLAGFVAVAAMAFFPTNIAPSISGILGTCANMLNQAASGS
jgi:Flp pilus assembly pilin Flp